jgi:hypothetical protein
MRRFTKKQYLVAGDAAAIIAGTAGSAIAYWTNSGSGTGSATTGTNAGITVNQTSPITGLYPGGTAQTPSGNFDNTNAGAVHVASVTTTGVTVDTASAGAGCLAADYVLGGTAPVNANVPSGVAQGSWSGLTVRLNDSGANQDACKGATITIAYASS